MYNTSHSPLKYKVAVRILKENGFSESNRGKGDHRIFVKDNRHISIPCGRDINVMLWKRIVKENNIIIEKRKLV